MRFKNKRTGAIIEVASLITGEDWVKIDETQPKVINELNISEENTENEIVEEVEESEDFDLTKMKVTELKKYAKDNDIEIPTEATKKDEIIAVIAEAFQG